MQTYLVTTLDGHVRLMDAATGKLLNDFSGHRNDSYRCRACFGYGEASVVCGDEDGRVWAWDLLDVRIIYLLPSLLWPLSIRRTRQNLSCQTLRQKSTTK